MEPSMPTRFRHMAKRNLNLINIPAFLREQEIEIIRFENRVVHQNIEAVLEKIREAVRNRSA